MKKIFFFLPVFLISYIVSLAQVVSTDPTIPIDTDPVKIIFDASKGTGGLQGFTGDVYAHTGVITDKSNSGSDWKYVKTNWGQNTDETKLSRIGSDLYELEIGPSIRSYYGVPSSEIIEQMAFVFRSADSSLEGKDDGGLDIFVDVYAAGFNVQINQPEDNQIIDPGTNLTIGISCTEEANIELLVNGIKISENTGVELDVEYEFTDKGNYWLIANADNGNEILSDTLFICVKENVILEGKPSEYKKGINYLDDQSVALVLWAPYKDDVFVLGDFNDWRPLNEYQMKKDGDYFWLEIENLEANKDYVYQYLLDGELLIADPYTDQVSDPYNDKHIPSSVYPNLIEYPFQSTSGMAAVLRTGQSPYEWEIENFIPIEKEKMIIYELLIRDFQEDHSYSSVIEKLDYLQTLGVNVLELMPVNEFEGNSSWGYNPSFYFAPDKYYGHKNELRRLVDECHKRGMAVVIDMVLNHSYGQSPFAQMYLDGGRPSTNNPWYNRDHNFTNPDAHWGYDFNHESIHTQELVDSINAFWMSEYKVDGFRFDFTKGIGNNIKDSSDPWGSKYDADRITLLKRMSSEIWNRNPNAIVIFEHLSENSEEKALANYGIMLWGNLNHDYSEAAMGYSSNLTWGLYSARGWDEANLVTYMESHDEERLMYKISQWGNGSGDYDTKDKVIASHRIGLNALFFLPLPGAKMIWQFGELGYDISIDQDCRICEKPILWEYYQEWQRQNIYNIMSNLNFLKSEYDIFSKGDLISWLSSIVKQYRMTDGNDIVVAVGNFDVMNRNTTVTLPATGTWYEFFSKTTMEVTDQSQTIALKAGEYKLFSTKEFEWKQDMSPVSVKNPDGNITTFGYFEFCPNPSRDYIQLISEVNFLQIFDLNGKLVLENSELEGKLNISFLNAGSYILLGKDDDGVIYHAKLIKE